MNLNSLQTRLWLTNVLLVVITLGLIFGGLVIYVWRNPIADRQAIARMQLLVDEIIVRADQEGLAQSLGRNPAFLQRFAERYQVRVLLINPQGEVVVDSAGNGLTLSGLQLRQNSGIVRDADDGQWVFVVQHFTDQNLSLVLAVPRTGRISLIQRVFGDELSQPFLQAALAALVIGLLLAWLVARWIARPLQRMASTAEIIAAGSPSLGQSNSNLPPQVPLEGPQEVVSLAQSFNQMTGHLYASQLSQREFLANVSHELKTPLTSIQGFGQAILDGAVESPEARQQAAGVIVEEAGRMNRLVLDLLDLARFDAGTVQLQREPVHLAEILRLVRDKFSLQARQNDVRLVLHAGTLPAVPGDGDRLSQVFSNLVENALKHTPQGGQVTITAGEGQGYVEVQVADSGPGIPAEDQPRIFERFYQVDKSRKGGRGHGVGLGLAIVAEIVQAHGGQISLRSVPAQGSVFVVKLPLARPDDSTLARRKAQR